MESEDPYRRMPATGAEKIRAAPTYEGDGALRPRREGLGGWLAVLAVVLLLWLVAGAANFAMLLVLTRSSHGPVGDALVRTQYMTVAVGVLFVVKLAVLALLWRRSRWFARAFVAWLAADIVVSAVFWAASAFDHPDIALFALLLFAARLLWNGAWIGYALKSERVRATFSARER